MKRFIDITIKPFLVITGLGTAAAGVNAFFPRFAVESVQKLEFVPDHTIFIQHWGIMVCLMGVFMIAAAFKARWRTPILLYSLIEKSFMVFLVASNLDHDFSRGFWAPAVMDAIVVLWSLAYFASLRRGAPAT
jgi:hypothetical protein